LISAFLLGDNMNKLELLEKNTFSYRLERMLGTIGTQSLDGRWSFGTCLNHAYKISKKQNYAFLYKRIAGFNLKTRRGGSQTIKLDLQFIHESKEKIVEDMATLMSHVLLKSVEYAHPDTGLTKDCFLDFLQPAKEEMQKLYPLGIQMMCLLDGQIRSRLFEEVTRAKTYDDIVNIVESAYEMQRMSDEKY